jgi:hypothetical protein
MKRIKILSDGNELEFKEKKVINKVPMLVYEYVVSKSKVGQTLLLSESELDKMVKNEIVKIL